MCQLESSKGSRSSQYVSLGPASMYSARYQSAGQRTYTSSYQNRRTYV